MSHNITVNGGTSVRLPTAGKYCDRDIVITATGSGGKYKTALEYLESTGTQYINTKVKLTSNHSVEIDYQITEIPMSGDRRGLFGGLDAAVGRYGSLVSPTTRKLEYGYGAGNIYYQTQIPDMNRHVFKQEKNKLYIDGSLVYTFAAATFSLPFDAPLGTFAYTNYSPAKARYYGSKWWSGDSIIRDLIPVLDWNDRPCMYDKVSGELFYNQGTGEFLYEAPTTELTFSLVDGTQVAISDIRRIDIPQGEVSIITSGTETLWQRVKLPAEYQEVSYLESTGTQYIDVNYAAGNNIKYQIVARILETKASSEYKGFFGTSIAPNTRCGSGFYNGKIRVQFGSGGAVYDTNYHDCNYTGYANKTTYELSKNGFYINGALEWKPKATLTDSTNVSIYLFNTHAELEYGGTLLKVYSFKVWNGDKLVRDFVPCYRKSDNKPGMYDRVTETFFTNAGTGEFLYGEEATVADYRAALQELGVNV